MDGKNNVKHYICRTFINLLINIKRCWKDRIMR